MHAEREREREREKGTHRVVEPEETGTSRDGMSGGVSPGVKAWGEFIQLSLNGGAGETDKLGGKVGVLDESRLEKGRGPRLATRQGAALLPVGGKLEVVNLKENKRNGGVGRVGEEGSGEGLVAGSDTLREAGNVIVGSGVDDDAGVRCGEVVPGNGAEGLFLRVNISIYGDRI